MGFRTRILIGGVFFFTIYTVNAEVIKSINSDICHTKTSPSIKQLKVLDDNSNIYKTLDDCLRSGGKLSKKMEKELQTEGSEVLEEKLAVQKAGEANTQFYGINWGVGLAYTFLKEDIIRDVTIENGIIRVNHKVNNRALAMIESHYFFTTDTKKYGHGPFIAVGLAGEDGVDPLSMYGIGYMWGWKTDDKGNSWNLGIGGFVDTEATKLRGGINDGDSTTETDPSKLLTKSDETGWILMFSATF